MVEKLLRNQAFYYVADVEARGIVETEKSWVNFPGCGQPVEAEAWSRVFLLRETATPGMYYSLIVY